MKRSSFTLAGSHDITVHVVVWFPDGEPKAVLQIVHGVSEHIERYNHVARFFTEQGFAVVGHDHPGHGQSEPEHPGHINAPDPFQVMTDTLGSVIHYIQETFSGIPHIILGHSMGSFILQRYLQLHSLDVTAIIYSGSNGKPPATLPAGRALASWIQKVRGADSRSGLLFNLIFGSYNRRFRPNRTALDWLSRDPVMVDLYIDDTRCGFICSTSFYRSLFRGLYTLHTHHPFVGINPDLPILILSGTDDPVSKMGKGIRNLERKLRTSGASDLTVKLYPGGRHEMLNESNRDEVMNDLLAWINSRLPEVTAAS